MLASRIRRPVRLLATGLTASLHSAPVRLGATGAETRLTAREERYRLRLKTGEGMKTPSTPSRLVVKFGL